ncbi:MAG: toll/interleukin-1 receptor domain-containing protein [Gammaproteobacteria bacterium]|nr:toll/interleukin-1 receptor domain-containing protein [Gammaproteobacteria bacterium]
MLGESKAVFLSYASEDFAAAERVAAALQAAGIEVWLDKSEIRGGDAWDAMIRGRIRGCALFVALISAHSRARGRLFPLRVEAGCGPLLSHCERSPLPAADCRRRYS